MTEVKHHGVLHLVLAIILFFVAMVVFGGWTEGPLTSGLFLGILAYNMVRTGSSGNLSGAEALSGNLLQLVIIFIINLVIFYIISTALIFIFNMFGGKK